MHLVMFDVDGTLTDTNRVDAEAYERAAREVLGIPDVETDWSLYKNVTDGGCLEEIILERLKRPALAHEVRRFKERFVEILGEEARENPSFFRALAGAAAMLESLEARPDVALALATGAWKESAGLKLRAAGLEASAGRLPMACGSDALTRLEIMRLAEQRALERAGAAAFSTRTYVGDAVWDVKAAAGLEYCFIGVASLERAAALRSAGARTMVPHYGDLARFLSLLEKIWAGPR